MQCSCMTENNQQSDKKEILINNQDKKYNSRKILKDNNFYSLRQGLRVKFLWKSWVMNKNLADILK